MHGEKKLHEENEKRREKIGEADEKRIGSQESLVDSRNARRKDRVGITPDDSQRNSL